MEAACVLRHILETFIQIRYFHRHKELLKAHLTTTARRGRVTFRTMFDEFSPGYYERIYGRLLSGMAHAGLHAVVIGMEVEHGDAGAVAEIPKLGSEFNVKGCTTTMNQTLPLVYGYLNYYPIVLKVTENEEIEAARSYAMRWLDEWMTGHRKEHERSAEWFDVVDNMIR